MLNYFSEELRKKREEAGLTIQQISSKTRIDKKYIEFIEQGNFTFLPEIYVRSFIREYASLLDLDPEETIKKYQLAKEGKPISDLDEKDLSETAEEKKHHHEPGKVEAKSFIDENVSGQPAIQILKKNGNLIIIGSVVIGLLIIFIIYYLVSSKDEIVIEETPFSEIVAENSQRFEELSNGAEDFTSPPDDSLSLQISSKDTTWVYLIIDNKIVNEFILYPNSKTVVKAKSNFEGTIGNSGSTVLKLNDKNLDFLGRNNLPRHFRLNKSVGLEYLSTRPLLSDQNVNR